MFCYPLLSYQKLRKLIVTQDDFAASRLIILWQFSVISSIPPEEKVIPFKEIYRYCFK